MNLLTIHQTAVVISSAGAIWLMVRAGTLKNGLQARERPRCVACGRKLSARPCPCGR